MSSHPTDRTARILLVRHGDTEWSRSGQHTSVTDLPLLPSGEAQARALVPVLSRESFSLVLSSPRQRALRTAQLAGFGDDVVIDANLSEWDYGAYEGLTSPEIAEQRGQEWYLWRDGVPAGRTQGETAEDVAARAAAVLARCAPILDGGGDVLVFAHSHLLRVLAVTWLGLPPTSGGGFTIGTGSISVLGFDHDRPVIAQWNCPPTV